LHGIIATADSLLEPPASDAAEGAEVIRDCAEHMLTLINDILDVERMEVEQLRLESVPFRPLDELQRLLKVFGHQASQKGIALELEADVKHPLRLGDPLRFKQVLFNLVSNAIKFSNDGGRVLITISDDDGHDDGSVRLGVEDFGIGISEDHIGHLFKVCPQYY
jgi:signal transduction histidine kinase